MLPSLMTSPKLSLTRSPLATLRPLSLVPLREAESKSMYSSACGTCSMEACSREMRASGMDTSHCSSRPMEPTRGKKLPGLARTSKMTRSARSPSSACGGGVATGACGAHTVASRRALPSRSSSPDLRIIRNGWRCASSKAGRPFFSSSR